MRKKVFLHIGLHKTGTTSLQRFLIDQRGPLLARGLFVPEKGAYELAKQVERDEYDAFGKAIETFRECPANAAMISSEVFDRLKLEPIATLESMMTGFDLKIIVVLRHPLELARASFCSLNRIVRQRPAEALRGLQNRRLLDYVGILRDWSQIAPTTVLFYEDEADVAIRILDDIKRDCGVETAFSETPVMRRRASLPAPAALLSQRLLEFANRNHVPGQTADGAGRPRIYDKIVRFLRTNEMNAIEWSTPLSELTPFAVDDRTDFLARWSESNALDDPSLAVNLNVDFSQLQAKWQDYARDPGKVEPTPEDFDKFKAAFFHWMCAEPLE